MRIPFMALALLMALPGCALVREVRLSPKVSRANTQMAAAKIDCDAKFPPVRGTLLAHARCLDAAENWVLRPLMPYPDLLSISQTNRETLAAKADRGEIDPAQVARLTMPEDARLTTDAATLDGPLTRWFPPVYYSPPAQPTSAQCATGYSFAGCN